MNQVKFSIIIPTRDRAEVLFYCLKTIINQTYQNLEIIVSNNHSIDNTEFVVKSFNDQRIKYIKPPQKLSMAHHFEFAFGHATGDYIGSIGDDDGLLPYCFEYLSSLISKYGRLAISNQYSKFYWGNNYNMPSNLAINMRSGAQIYNSSKVLERLYNFQNYYSSCPIVYYGFIPIELYHKAKKTTKNNRFFNSMIPDIYSALLLSNITETFIYSNQPYCIAGVSKHSNGQSSINGQSKEQKEEGIKFITEAEVIPFHPKVDMILSSIPIMIAESYFQLKENISIDLKLNLDLEKCLKVAYRQALAKELDKKQIEIDSIKRTCLINNIDFNSILSNFTPQKNNFVTMIKSWFEPKVIIDHKLINILDAVNFHEKYYNSHSHFKYNLGRIFSMILKRSKYV